MRIPFKKTLKNIRNKIRSLIAKTIEVSNIEAAFAKADDDVAFGIQLTKFLESRPQNALNIINEGTKAYSYYAHLGNLLKIFNINFVIDAGAHSGQFANCVYSYSGYKGEIHSFEPVTKYYDILKRCLKNYKGWKAYNSALGDEAGTSVIHLGKGHGGTSSLLKHTDNLTHFAPCGVLEGTQEIMVQRVDELFGNVIEQADKRVLLKLDVQGFESRVLASCGKYLTQFKMILIELASLPLYEGQESIGFLCTYLENNGYVPIHVVNNFEVHRSIVLDYDFIFVQRLELEKLGLAISNI
jgi:FkbM family methyltransferase